LCDVADAAIGMAFVTLKFNFFRPVWQARLRFDARVVNRSENTAYLDCEIADHDAFVVFVSPRLSARGPRI
jgi:acyl-coenzyme A thioesterase PaaI-like protein